MDNGSFVNITTKVPSITTGVDVVREFQTLTPHQDISRDIKQNLFKT